jgi:hypothetical protein
MTDLEALERVYNMAVRALDIGGVPYGQEEKAALTTVRTFIRSHFPLVEQERFRKSFPVEQERAKD